MGGMMGGARPGMMGGMQGMAGKGGMQGMMGKGMGMGQQKGMGGMGGMGMPGKGAARPQMPMQGQAQPGFAPRPVDGNAPLTAAALANAPPGMQKQMLGEKIFPLIARLQPEMAGKVTGMMLEMDNAELLILIESPHQLKAKVDEALRVIQSA